MCARWFYAFNMVCMLATSANAQQVTVALPPSTDPARRDQVQTASLSEAEVRDLSRKVERSLRDVVLRGARDPRIGRGASAPADAVSLEVGNDGTAVGKAKLSWRLDNIGSSVDVILRGPLTQGSGTPLSDRGLSNGASGTLQYNLTLWGQTVAAPAATSARSVARASTPSRQLTSLEALVASGLALAREGDNSRSYQDAALSSVNSRAARDAFLSMDPRRVGFVLRESRAAGLERTVMISGSYTAAVNTFKFAELADPIVEQSQTEDDNSFSVDVAYAQLLREGDDEAPLLLISAGYSEAEKYAAKRSRQVCTPLGLGSATECRSLTFGAPTLESTSSVNVDIRSWAYAAKLGINPLISYDRSIKKWTSEVSLSYLVLSEDRPAGALPRLNPKALTVGVRVGRRPDESGGVFASVFFASVLSRD